MDVLLVPQLFVAVALIIVSLALAYQAVSAWWWARERSRRWSK